MIAFDMGGPVNRTAFLSGAGLIATGNQTVMGMCEERMSGKGRGPGGRLVVLGDHRANTRDARALLDDRGGTLPESVLRGRAMTTACRWCSGRRWCSVRLAVPTEVGMGIAAVVVGRRARSATAFPPPWAVRI
ncbi:hypothetical protein ACIBQ5_37550 [Streptomyces massasporeus]|uniref:hypothetical protein n=1 Tax=Streptomyces massasporeus TaxID=67324 RepID=UPI0037AD83F0